MQKQIFFQAAIAAITLIFSIPVSAQQIKGDWEGKLRIPGTELPLVFHISENKGSYTASFDSPKQQAFNIACSEVVVQGDSIILKMNSLNGFYAATLDAERKVMNGSWAQSGYTFPLIMKKVSESVTRGSLKRPQTPIPPFPYKSEDVSYTNADKSIQFSGTFTVPLPDPNVDYFRAPIYPTVLLISGSGPQDRDETIMEHKPFAVIADYLSRNGIAVLRVDDRGVGKTTGKFATATSADFANDVEAGIAYLKTREDVDANGIGLIGHSEGGLIAPMVASRNKDVRFIILLAAPGVKIPDMMAQQNADVLASASVPAVDIEQYIPLYKNIVSTIINAKDSAAAMKKCIPIFKAWQKNKTASTIKNTTGVENEAGITSFINIFIKDLSTPWFKYFMQANPADYLSQTNCPVLALNGEKDIQVAAVPNLAGIKQALEKANNSKVTTRLLPGLNHLFQHCQTCTVAEYGELEETFDPATLKIMADWIRNEAFK